MPESLPFVSYIIPSYNHAAFIEGTLKSILADGYSNKELLIIDDGSKDNSPQLIQSFLSRHPELRSRLVARANRGLCATLNELVDMAQGEYLRICSSDDLLLPGSTEALVRAVQSRTGALAAFGDAEVMDDQDAFVTSSAITLKRGNIRGYIRDTPSAVARNWAVCGPVLLVRRSFFTHDKFRYDENLRIDDWFIYLALVARDALLFIPQPVAKYRLHANNSSRTKDVSARLANQASQLSAVNASLGQFRGPLRQLLLAEQALIRAKIDYLRRRYLAGMVSIAKFAAFRAVGTVLLCLRSLR